MFKGNKNLFIIAVIAVVNALGYGIIIPILYSYSQKYGLSDFQNGLLFAVFAICQFASTPIIGRLSDRYGRRPLLLISLAGTFISFIMMAFAPSALFLFLARALDGITAGNIPVASAVISDTTPPHERARGFGIIGAAFGFGFVFGPAISALTLGFGESIPFLIAAAVTAVAIVLTAISLPETNKHIGDISQSKLFDFRKLALHLFDEKVGKTLLISFLYAFAFFLFVYAYQPFSVKVLHLSPQSISLIFTMIGVVGFVSQVLIIPRVVKKYGDRTSLMGSLVATAITFLGFFLSRTAATFISMTGLNAVANSFVGPMTQTLLSKEVDEKSQGTIQGVNSSYVSLGQIAGPIVGGIVATISITAPFLLGCVICAFCAYLGWTLAQKPLARENISP